MLKSSIHIGSFVKCKYPTEIPNDNITFIERDRIKDDTMVNVDIK